MLIIIDEELLIITEKHPYFEQLKKKLYRRKFKSYHKAQLFIEKNQFTIYYKFIKNKENGN